MLKKSSAIALACSICIALPVAAQQWITRLPQKSPQELTLTDFRQAFKDFYKSDTEMVRSEDIRPVFRFDQPAEAQRKKNIEEIKLFKRWEWLMEPRMFPSGRLDLEKVGQIRARLEIDDDDLVLKQREKNPLNVRFEANKIIWPPLFIWTALGPFDAVGGTNLGRVNCIEFRPGNINTIYIGAPDGGVWKSVDGGANWTTKFGSQPTLSVGDIAIYKGNTNIMYAATSDAFGYGVPFWGGTYSVGVVKSTNAGDTWAPTGLTWNVGQNRTIRRLVIHPTNFNILLAATSNGLYRTTDGGTTWSQIWSTSTYDVEFQHNNGNIVYATTTKVHKSTNAGATFVDLTATCGGSRYNIEIAQSNTNVLYTLCTSGTVQKSTNAGTTWATVTAPGATLYGYYDNVLAVSPVNASIVYVAGFNIRRTTDGGTTWGNVPTAGHVDNHCIEFFPGSSSSILCGNDGGLFKTTNSGTTWSSLNKGLAITQFYRIGVSKTNANIMLCGAQDNGNMKYNAGAFTNVTNADGMDVFIDWSNSNNLYAGIQYGSFHRSTNGGVSFTNISPPGSGAWVAPWCQHPTVANTIFAGKQNVYKSTNQGTTWAAISGALAGISTFTVLKVAQSNPQVIYAGDGNKLYVTANGGTTWTDITAGLPVASNYLTGLAISDKDPKIAYVTFSGYNAGQKVYKTTNQGATWTNISGTLPNMPANCIAYENNAKNALYVGTDASVYYINDDLSDWVPYKLGMPNVIVTDFEIHYGTKKIRAATYGRGVWQAALKSI